MVMEGRLYEGLPEEERYYLTQLLIDLFDEMVESEAVSDELPHAALEEALAPVRVGAAAALAGWLTRGRLFGSDEPVWDGRADLEEILPFFSTLTREELPALIEALERVLAAPGPPRGGARRGGGKGDARLLEVVRQGARAALETDRDLLAFVA
jgi:hypothetical protein